MHEKQKQRLKHGKQYEAVRGPFVLQTGEPDELPLNLVKVDLLISPHSQTVCINLAHGEKAALQTCSISPGI